MIELLVFVIALVIYYGLLVKIADRVVLKWVLKRLHTGSYSAEDILSTINIAVAGVFQIAVLIFLVVFFKVPLLSLLTQSVAAEYLLLIPLLAVAQLSLSGILATLIMAIVTEIEKRKNKKNTYENWRTMMSSGWLKSFNRSYVLLPKWASIGLFFLYLACEEILFRGVALHSFPFSNSVTILIISILFVLVQTSGMPSIKHALFPVSGAIVMGPIHAYLGLCNVPLLVLILTHFLFFWIATSSSSKMERLSRTTHMTVRSTS